MAKIVREDLGKTTAQAFTYHNTSNCTSNCTGVKCVALCLSPQ